MCPPRLGTRGQGLLFCSAGRGDVARMLGGGGRVLRSWSRSPACILTFTEGIPLALPCLVVQARACESFSQTHGRALNQGGSWLSQAPCLGRGKHEKNAGISQRPSCGKEERGWQVGSAFAGGSAM